MKEKRIKVLILGAAPTDEVRLALGREVREIDRRLQESDAGRRVDLVQAWAVRAEDLHSILLRHKPDVVHFSGHGSPTGELMFEDANGLALRVPVKTFGQLFALLPERPRCVVLNACGSVQQAEAIHEHIDCVVGMKRAVTDSAAIAFGSSFYLALGHGESVRKAYALVRHQIELAGRGEQDIPMLLCRPGVDPESVILAPPGADMDRDGPRGPFGARDSLGREPLEERWSAFLLRVERVALLRNSEVKVTRHAASLPFAGVLELSRLEGGLAVSDVVGALEKPITEELVERYIAEVERPFRQADPWVSSLLVHGGPQAPEGLLRSAYRRGVKLRSFSEYQGIIDFSRYLEKTASALEVDPIYPPWLYVEQPALISAAMGRDERSTESALSALMDLLDEPGSSFALVLGNFGAGKTFLLHELARRMARGGHRLVPVLVEMSRLEKQRTLRELLAQHFAPPDIGRIDLDAFNYMLRQGRVALLFDGFDELANRTTYAQATEHFETVTQAAQGDAKVIISSRTQYFWNDHQVKRALAERAERIPGYRLFQLKPFGEPQIRLFLGNLLKTTEEAEARYRLIDEVKDLLGLSKNPRMLGFIAKIEREKLESAKAGSGEITAAKLYELLIDQWLDFEYRRANPPGAPKGIERHALRVAMTELALSFWRRNAKTLSVEDLPECFQIAVHAPEISPEVATHMVGSGSLLVRDADGRFEFVHRSVMEWLVAEAAARDVKENVSASDLEANEVSNLMADFFVSLAGEGAAGAWAARALSGEAKGHTKTNAMKVVDRVADVTSEVALDLSGQDLSGQDFSGLDLRGVNMEGARLLGASLVGTNLRGAVLIDAHLERADLSGANLSRANLLRAKLSFARLFFADLRGALNLRTADFRGAKLICAQMEPLAGAASLGAALPAAYDQPIEWMWAVASPCRAISWSSVGSLIATGHADGKVRIWDAVSGQAIRTFYGHVDAVNSVAWSPDSAKVASGSDDGTVRVWEVGTGRALHALEGHKSGVMSVAWSPDGGKVAFGALEGTVCVWEVGTGRALRTFEGHKGGVMGVAWSPDGEQLASGSEDRTVRVWEVATGRALRALERHKRGVMGVAWSPDGAKVASGSEDQMVCVWDVATGRALRALAGHVSAVKSVAFSPDGEQVVSGSDDWTVCVWEVGTGRARRALMGHTGLVRSVAWSPDGEQVASASDDRTVRVWDAATGQTLRAFEGHPAGLVRSVAWSPDGAKVASGSADQMVRVWEVGTGRALRAFAGHMSGVRSVAFSPDGTKVASGSSDQTVRLWEMETDVMLPLEGHTNGVFSVAWSPDGAMVASGSADQTVRVWDVETGRALRAFEGHTGSVRSVVFSPDGEKVASGSDDRTVCVWEVGTGRVLRALKGHTHWVRSVAFSGDGAMVASGSADQTVRVWDVETGRALRALEGHTYGIMSVAFSPDGTRVASGSHDQTVRLWDVGTGRAFRVLEGHTDGVMSVAWSPDGQLLATGSNDGTIRLWDVMAGRCSAILLPTPKGWAAFTPDGRYKFGGDIAGSFWQVIGLCRFEPGELDPYLPHPLRIPDEVRFRDLPPL